MRSPDYYHNRRKLKQLAVEGKKFRPTVEDVKEWFYILNEQIFGGKLPQTKLSVKRLQEGFHAFYHYHKKSVNTDTEIEMHNSFDNKKLFVEILTHEMIHHFQHTYDEPVGHGPSFTAWRDNLKLKGLTLHKVA